MTQKIFLISPTCPGCEQLKQHLIKNNLLDKYKMLDITTKEGAYLAKKLGITHVPNCAIVEETPEGRRARLCSDDEFKEILTGK